MAQVIGTPDWQRGVVTPNKLLATIPAGTLTYDIDLPANANKIVIARKGSNFTGTITVTGTTSGIEYPGGEIPFANDATAGEFLQFTVLPVVDSKVTLTFAGWTVTTEFYVYTTPDILAVSTPDALYYVNYQGAQNSGSGITMFGIYDGNNIIPLFDSHGRQIPLVPTVGDSATVAAGTTQLVAAPVSDAWYLFGLDVYSTGSTNNPVYLKDSLGNTIAYDNPPTGGESHTVELQGFRTTGSVSVIATAAATVTLRYAPGP